MSHAVAKHDAHEPRMDLATLEKFMVDVLIGAGVPKDDAVV